MGARGNSGVILSQLFRGFSRYAAPYEELNTLQFASALQSGVDAAYKAVVKPVEGTILTVAKEAAKHAVFFSRRTNDITELMEEVLAKAKETLAMTQDMLPVLKQVGVVDSGGQGLVYIYEGFMQHLGSGLVTSPTAKSDNVRPVLLLTYRRDLLLLQLFLPQMHRFLRKRSSKRIILNFCMIWSFLLIDNWAKRKVPILMKKPSRKRYP